MWKGVLAVLMLAGSAAADPFLSGSVTDARGAAVPGAVVTVVKLDARWRPVASAGASLPLGTPLAFATTDASGAFRIDGAGVPPGLHAIAFAVPGAPGVLRHRERIAFGPAALPSDLALRVPPLVACRGLALDETGAALPGVQVTGLSVTASDAGFATATADETGAFTLPTLAGATLTLVGAAGARWGIVRSPVAGDDVTLALHLAPPDVIDGTAVASLGGRPMAGVRIRALAPTWDPVAPTSDEGDLPPWGDAPVLTDATTGDDGRFLARVPAGGIALATGPHAMAILARSGRIEITAASPVRGVVTDELGAPVAGADVRWSELPDAVRTDAQGRFELLPDVNAAVVVTTDDGARRSVKVESVVQDLRIVLPSRSVVSGTLRATADAAGIAGATVRLTTDPWDVLTATDAAGRFALTLRGVRRIAARQGALAAEASPGENVALLLRPQGAPPSPRAAATSPIRLRVTDEAGRPLAGAIARAVEAPTVQLPEAPDPAAGSGKDGRAALHAASAHLNDILVIRPGRAPEWLRGVKPGADVSVKLMPGAVLQGIVRDPEGRPVGGAAVVAEREADRASATASLPSIPERRAALSDAGGQYVLRDMPAGRHAVDVVAGGFASPPRQRVTLVAGQVTALDLAVAAGATLRGLVHDASGPVAGAEVRVSARAPTFSGDTFGVAGSARGTYTLDDGSFEVDGLEGDQWYDVAVVAAWHAPATGGGRPSESLVDIVMTATGVIEGETEGDSTDARVVCTSLGPRGAKDPRDFGYAAVEDGKFTVDAIAPGAYECSVEGELVSAKLDRVEVKAGVATQVRVRLEERPFIAVDVRALDTGRPVAGADVYLPGTSAESGDDGRARLPLPQPRESEATASDAPDVVADEDGAAGDPSMAAWQRTLRVTAAGYEEATIELPSPPPKSLNVTLAPLPRLRGRVVDADGLPAGGATVSWGEMPSEATSDADGAFEIALPDGENTGPWTLVASRVRGDVVEKGSTEAGGDPSVPVIVTLARIEPAELAVIVRDASGPVAGARVTVMGDEATQGATNAEGTFVAQHLQPGEFGIIVETEAGATAMRRGILLEAGEHARETVVVGEGWWIEGRVLRAGRPVEGAQVMWMSPGTGEFGAPSMSRVDGSFRAGPVAQDDDEVRLMVVPSGSFRPRELDVRRGDGPVTINVASVTLGGRVVSGDAPVARAMVRLRCPSSPGGGSFGRTDDSGVFSIEDAPGDSACDLLVDPRDRPALALSVRTNAEGAQDLGDIRLESRVVRGVVRAPEGSVVASLRIQLVTPGGSRLDTNAVPVAGDGSFELGVASLPVAFIAQAEGADLGWLMGTIAPDVPLELDFEPGGSLEVLATRADGTPVDAFAGISEWNGRSVEGLMVDGGEPLPEGSGVITGLPAGHVVVLVATEGGQTRAEADVVPGQTRRLTVTVR